jgi:cellulose synthase (UDP-forming)
MSADFYFTRFEQRRPYAPVPDNIYRTLLFQFCGIITIVLGFAYINWRWRYSLNPDALWFAIPLAVAETLSFVSTIMVVINFWAFKDPGKEPPVHYRRSSGPIRPAAKNRCVYRDLQ